MDLPSPKTTNKSKIVGRGIGSGKGGHTTGRGTKGQKSRSGYKKPRPDFEGGQNPISKRLPKLKGSQGAHTRTRGFKTSKVRKVVVKLSTISEKFDKGSKINMESLFKAGLIKEYTHKSTKVKILFDKELDKSLEFSGLSVSKQATQAIEKAGGKVSAE